MGTPWDQREKLGVILSIFLTIKQALFLPGSFFSRMKTNGDLGSPLGFAIIVGSISIIISLIVSALPISYLNPLELDGLAGAAWAADHGKFLIYAIIFAPLLVILDQFVSSGILHLCLIILGGNKKGFGCTFSVVAYSQSYTVLTIIPIIGYVIGNIWRVVMLTIGLAKSHGTSSLRTFFAICLPLIVVMVLVIIVLVAFAGFLAAIFLK
ncbi:MAG: YIP1 family protein [Deltaproteobacteria bacterium]|nr:YIP1 family protein [Deltaproteobacteria bacterium]